VDTTKTILKGKFIGINSLIKKLQTTPYHCKPPKIPVTFFTEIEKRIHMEEKSPNSQSSSERKDSNQ
jgi:hypothetical protein